MELIIKLQGHSNVRMLGTVSIKQVKNIVKNSLVCIVPYKTVLGSEYVNLYPRFLHLYMSVHKPVISTIDFGIKMK